MARRLPTAAERAFLPRTHDATEPQQAHVAVAFHFAGATPAATMTLSRPPCARSSTATTCHARQRLPTGCHARISILLRGRRAPARHTMTAAGIYACAHIIIFVTASRASCRWRAQRTGAHARARDFATAVMRAHEAAAIEPRIFRHYFTRTFHYYFLAYFSATIQYQRFYFARWRATLPVMMLR